VCYYEYDFGLSLVVASLTPTESCRCVIGGALA